jgi:hypothetical protein
MSDRSKRRPVLFTIACAFAILLLVIVAGLPVYVFPRVDEQRQADVVFVIGPPTFDRIRLARGLIDAGYADTLVVSVAEPDSPGSYVQKICDSAQAERVICLRPEPYTTQGEARALRALAEKNNWDSATVITATPHISRSRLIFERCFTGDLNLLATSGPKDLFGWVEQYVYQTGAFLKAWVHPEC